MAGVVLLSFASPESRVRPVINFNQIQPQIFVGTYPQSALDIDRLRMGPGVTAVLNLQTEEDFQVLGVRWERLMERYLEHDLVVQRYPIRDFDRDDLREHLPGVAGLLNDMLAIGHRVYIHCTAGVGRAPAVAIAYLAWHKEWDLERAYEHVREARKCDPYIDVIRELDGARTHQQE